MTRRDLLLAGAACVIGPALAARAAAQGLGQFMTPSVPCGDVKPTPEAPDAASFRPGAPRKASLVEPGITGERLTLTGTVSGVICGPIRGARVDFWQADAKGVYDDKGFRLRGHVISDAGGVYRIETVLPAPYGHRARHLNARVTAEGKPTLMTQLFIAGDPANSRDPHFKPELAMTLTKAPAGWAATFAFVLNA